jgi:hypothetical protein
MYDALIGELTTLIVRNCDAGELLAEHRCLHGGYCSCSTPNVPREWPCTVHQVAERAHKLVAASLPRVPTQRVR